MNYYLYRSNFIFSEDFLTKPDGSEQEKNNAKPENVSIDNVLVSIIKTEISKIKSSVIETEDLEEIVNIFNDKNPRNWKIDTKSLNEQSIEQQRELYLLFIASDKLSPSIVKSNAIACEKKREDAEKWMCYATIDSGQKK